MQPNPRVLQAKRPKRSTACLFMFTRWPLLDFVADCRHMIEEDLSPGRWARAFMEAQADPACAPGR